MDVLFEDIQKEGWFDMGTKAEDRAINAFNDSLTNRLNNKKDYKTNDYINLETYAPNFNKEGADIPTAGKAIEAADYEIKREISRAPKATTIDKIRSAIGIKKGGKVKSSASKRADGIATKGFTKGRYM
jgi:hypothetical protein